MKRLTIIAFLSLFLCGCGGDSGGDVPVAGEDSMTLDGSSYDFDGAAIVYLGTDDRGGGWHRFDVNLYKGDIDPGPADYLLALQTTCPSDTFAGGEFSFMVYGPPGTFSGYFFENEEFISIGGGSLKVDISGDSYEITMDCTSKDGKETKTLKAAYTGPVTFIDGT